MSRPAVEVADFPPGERGALEHILEESFEGLYLRHSLRTLRDIGTVRGATSEGVPIGLIMVRNLDQKTGYVYYVAVAKGERGKGVATLLLRDALERFRGEGAEDVFASVGEDNAPSWKLFASEGFARTSISEVAKTYGAIHTLNMYRLMMVVPGEVLLHRSLGQDHGP